MFFLAIVVSAMVAKYLSETTFFDKFIYYKRVDYGYWIPGKPLKPEDFGERSKDLLALNKAIEFNKTAGTLGASSDPAEYTVAIIGDSYVWGQGVKFSRTVSQLLKKKLMGYRNVRILSFGNSGDSILDYFLTWQKTKQIYNVDLYIFVLVDNDLMLEPKKRELYEITDIYVSCLRENNSLSPVYRYDDNNLDEWRIQTNNQIEKLKENLLSSWKNPTNLCILSKSLESLRSEKAIFLVSQYYHEDSEELDTYDRSLKLNSLHTLYFADSKKIIRFQHYWNNPDKNFTVSARDGHPSQVAHQIFAELLFNEILGNPKWNFQGVKKD